MKDSDPSVRKPNHFGGPMRCPKDIADVDLFGQGAQEHWYEAYPLLHAHAPVQRIPGEGYAQGSDGYILSSYEDIALIVRDPIRFPPTTFLALEKIAAAGKPPDQLNGVNAMLRSMLSLRPNNELWRTHRKELTDPWVGPGAQRHKAMIEQVAGALLDNLSQRVARGETVEFVREFARPLPQMVMANILGFPLSDLSDLARWGDAQVAGFVYGRGRRNEMNAEQIARQAETLKEFEAYTAELIKVRRAEPREDMISFLTQVHYSGVDRKLTDIEINGIVYAMVIGGLETTQYAITEQAQLLCEHDGLWQRLAAQRDLVRDFTEESMRLRSPTQGLSTRITSADEVFQGVSVPKGSLLHLRWAAANVDPSEWRCPFELDVGRKAVTRHLVFSQGPRVCPGASLSRLEQTLAWNALLERFDAVSYAPNNSFEHQPGIMLGTKALNLRFEPRAAHV